jgi:hypothetical protein
MGINESLKQPTYPDTGCRYATDYLGRQSSCLECPFPQCFTEAPRKYQFWKNRKTREKILELWRQGKSVKEIATILDVSQHKIYAILNKVKSFVKEIKTKKATKDT